MSRDRNALGRIGVLMGGVSSERKVSLKSGTAVYKALARQGCDVLSLDIVDQEKETIASFIREAAINVAFIALHGRMGEDGAIQSILEEMNIPYTGSGTEASRLAMNKLSSQNLFKKNNISVPPYVTLSKNDGTALDTLNSEIASYPVVVKPASEGSSIGISIVHSREELAPAIKKAWEYDDDLLIEQYIQGRELTVDILDQQALPVLEICPKRKFFDYDAKYQKGLTDYIVPAKIPPEIAGGIQSTALKAHRLLGCAGFSRVDFMLGQDSSDYLLEVNTIPGFTETSLLPKAALATGLTFDQLCLTITHLAYAQKEKKQNITLSR